jgi:lysozyme family protein
MQRLKIIKKHWYFRQKIPNVRPFLVTYVGLCWNCTVQKKIVAGSEKYQGESESTGIAWFFLSGLQMLKAQP